MNSDHYILDKKHEPIIEPDDNVWAKWMEENRVVSSTGIDNDTFVSTIFTGMDLKLTSSGPPQFFETMTFSSIEELDGYQARYEKWDDAVKGHEVACQLMRDKLAKKEKQKC